MKGGRITFFLNIKYYTNGLTKRKTHDYMTVNTSTCVMSEFIPSSYNTRIREVFLASYYFY